MNEEKWRPYWTRGGKIEEIAWIGKDILAWCTGLHIVFFDIVRKTEILRRCSSNVTGEGARCISGHSTLSIFAFSEKVPNPRILIYAYPSMTKIAECSRGCRNGYLSTAFSARDYLITIGSYPDFPLIVWNWRNGEKILTVNTVIRDEIGQILRVTQLGRPIVAQMGKTCGKLFTWEIDIVGNVTIIKDHEVKLPKGEAIYWAEWSPVAKDPQLAITDKNGHIFLSDYNGSNVYRIVLSQRCGVCQEIELPMVSWFRGGIILRTTYCQIRYYKKTLQKYAWRREWYVKSATKPSILLTHPFKNDRFYYHTYEGYLMEVDFPEGEGTPSIRRDLSLGGIYRFVDLVYPWCHHLVVTEDLKELVLLECYSGTEVSRIDPELNGEISCQASHLDYPWIVLVSNQGELVILSFVDPDKPNVLVYMNLQKGPLDLINFSQSGRFVVAAEKRRGNCYCINLFHEKSYTVQTLVQVQRRITDVLAYEVRGRLKLLVLYLASKRYRVGQQLLLYDIPEDTNLITRITAVLDLPGVYRNLFYIPATSQSILGSPYLTRQLRVQRIQDFNNVNFVDSLSTGHQTKLVNIYVDRHWIVTAGFDGLIFVRDKSVRRVLAAFMAHHRYDFGTKRAMTNRTGDLILCLGYDGSLLAMKTQHRNSRKESIASSSSNNAEVLRRVNYTHYEIQKSKILADYASLESSIRDLLTRTRQEIPPLTSDTPKTWFEWRQELEASEEAKRYHLEKATILHDFNVLKNRVKELLDANETCSDLEKLPVSSFDLDKAVRDQKLKAARDEREDTRQELEHDSHEMERVSAWIRTSFWTPQKILGKSLFAIFGTKEVTNYPLIAEDPGEEDRLQWAEFFRESVRRIMESDTFEPWRKYTEEELREELKKRAKLYQEDERKRMDMLLEEEERDADQTDTEIERVTDGTTTHRFVEPSPYYYNQMESYGFAHVMLNNQFLMHDCAKLRLYFNKIFDDVYAMKERKMNLMRERIERIRHIDSELRTMFGLHVPHVPDDPTWHPKEKPESIVRVLEHEVEAKPYVSPSQQEILDKQAFEAERIRQLLLADDFRERTLMKMMDGVLEVRWEDVIKNDIPKPRCMIEKQPEEYSAEDILTVKQYEKDVETLQRDRERYKRILEADYVKVTGVLQEGIEKFNGKLDELFQLKNKVEAAINQMNLRYVRGCTRSYRRIKALDEEVEHKEKISEHQQYQNTLNDQLQTLKNIHSEFLAQNEALCNREKTMTRKFKAEFSSVGKTNLEYLERQYKRRPRVTLKNICANDLSDLANRVISHHIESTHLPSECIEYLNILDALDARPNLLPPSIEISQWDQLTRLRRQRIDLELRIKAKQAEIMDLENLIDIYILKINEAKDNVETSRKKLEETRKDRVTCELDAEVQLALKMGQVEIRLHGDLSDTENAILVSRTEIDAVNVLIHEAGLCKLDALTRMMNFQRGTLMKEWEHECLRKRLEDLEEDLRFTRNATMTKEMQQYLKRQLRDPKEEKSPERLEIESTAAWTRYESIVAKHQARNTEIEKEILRIQRKNRTLDQQILTMNVTRCEMEQQRDLIAESKHREYTERKMLMFMKRSDLIRKLQDNYAELLALQTEHELLRLRRYPMFEFRRLDEDTDKKERVLKSPP